MTEANRNLFSWAFYDFANTIFSAVVLTFYFPLYLTDLTHRNFHLGVATTAAMVLAGLAVPWLGTLSDQTGQTKALLIGTTVLCVIFTFSLSFFTTIPMLMAAFLLACFFFHASLVFYNALLPSVARPGKEGYASGLGTALGYLGVLFSIPIAQGIDSFLGRRFVFLSAAFLFLLFSLPLFLWVPERTIKNPVLPSFVLFLTSWKEVLKTGRLLAQKPVFRLFFLGNFFVVEAMNAVIFWLVIYIARVFNPPPIYLMATFLGLNFSAFLFGWVAGILTDRWGSQQTLLSAAVSLFVTLLILGFTKNLWFFMGVGILGGGFGFAGVWTAGRKRLIELAPQGSIGEYFGLYNLTTKISVIWSLIFSFLADHVGFQIALLSLALPSGLGSFLLWASTKATPRHI